MKARALTSRGNECPIRDPMVDLSHHREGAGEVYRAERVDGTDKNKQKKNIVWVVCIERIQLQPGRKGSPFLCRRVYQTLAFAREKKPASTAVPNLHSQTHKRIPGIYESNDFCGDDYKAWCRNIIIETEKGHRML